MKRTSKVYLSVISFTIILFSSCGTTKTPDLHKDNRTSIQKDKVINYAKKQIGVKYKYAGNTPKEGFDCSGFTKYVFSNFGFEVPRRSVDYEKTGTKVSLNNCTKCDVILFTGRDKSKRVTGHVGIVVSNNNGTVKFIHASSSRGVVISDMKVSYYKERILGVRRIINK